MEGVGGTPQLLPSQVPWSLSPLSPWAAPQQAHHCGTGCVESHRRLGAGGMRLCSKRVNKSIFKWEAVGEGTPPRAGLLCCWQGLARGLEAQGQVSASPCCFLGGEKTPSVVSRRGAGGTLQAPPGPAPSLPPSVCPQGQDPLPGTHLAPLCEPYNPFFLPSPSKHGCCQPPAQPRLPGPCCAGGRCHPGPSSMPAS